MFPFAGAFGTLVAAARTALMLFNQLDGRLPNRIGRR
jgi:hypothetical protein